MSAVYRSVRGAIRAAYQSEVAEVWGRQATIGCFGFGDDDDGVRRTPKSEREKVLEPGVNVARFKRSTHNPFATSWYEHIAEASWCMALIRDTLDDDLMTAVDAKYTRLGDPLLEVRKYAAVIRLSGMVLRAGVYGPPDYDYTIATVAEWSGFGALNSEIWAAHLGRTKRTMRNWRYGRGDYGVGIDDRLRVYLGEAHYQLEIAMSERGLVFRADDVVCDNRYIDSRKRLAAWSGVLRLRTRETSDERTDIRAAA